MTLVPGTRDWPYVIIAHIARHLDVPVRAQSQWPASKPLYKFPREGRNESIDPISCGSCWMKKIQNIVRQAGAVTEGKVEVHISYDIIRHVSAQLYTNPRKAIEELITNSYDAGATQCWVRLPKVPSEPLAVLDDGKSMDLNGIKDLWRVASSPKVAQEGENTQRIDNNRMQIGKFGVGKLAAFALGGRLTHVSCIKRSVRVVSVGQSEIQEEGTGRAPRFDVYKLSLKNARRALVDFFKDFPHPWDENWETWTLALVEEIDEGKSGRALKLGFLKRMIMTALPISADYFRVFLESEPVPKRQINPNDIEIKVDVTSLDFRKKLEETLQSFWQSARDEERPEDVPSNLYKVKVESFPCWDNVSKKAKGIAVPELGPVIGSAVLTKTSLTTVKLEERGYLNNGFAIYTNGKLVNPEDELFGVTQRSHAYWSRFLARVEMPGLDRVLLVQRNAVSENSNEAQVAREVLRTLFNFTRSEAEKYEERPEYKPPSFGSRVKALSPILGTIALRGLAKGNYPREGLDALDIDFATLGQDGPSVQFDPATQKILVNADHPLIIAIDDLGPRSKPIRRMTGEVLAGIQMANSYLESRGVEQEIVYESSEIMEVALRSAAGFVRDEIETHITAIDEASYTGGDVFERAVVAAFRSLRLAARHVGSVGKPDGTIDIPISGSPNLRISVEAKGSKGVITHKELSEATVSRHRQEQDCTAAIAIAREFSTEGIGGKESALLRETRGKVPLITVAGIARLLRLHKKRPFTYDKIRTILQTWNHPDYLEDFIKKTWKEVPDIGLMRLVLEVAHKAIETDDTNLPDPGMILANSTIKDRKVKREEIIHVLNAVQITTGMIVIKNSSDYQFELLASVDTILEALQRSATSEESAESPEGGSKEGG